MTSCTSYYFALKTIDDAGNVSALSNVLSITTGCSGGGMLAASTGTDGLRPQNVLLGDAQGTGSTTDTYRLAGIPVESDSTVRLTFQVPYACEVSLSGMELLAVSHDSTSEAFVLANRPILGTRAPARSVTRGAQDLTTQLAGARVAGIVLAAADTLAIGLQRAVSRSVLILEAAQVPPYDSSSLTIQAYIAGVGWRPLGRPTPRARFSALLLDSLPSDSVRVSAGGPCAIRYVGVVSPSGAAPVVSPLKLVAARHSRLGDVRNEVTTGLTVPLGPGDTLATAFAALSATTARTDYFIAATGSWINLTQPQPGLKSFADQADLPRVFALYPARPNPSRGSTRIRFDVPRATDVSLEIFDLLGRRVRTLVGGAQSVGLHEVSWNHTTDDGSRVAPGVYWYRMVAGEFRSQRKVLLLP